MMFEKSSVTFGLLACLVGSSVLGCAGEGEWVDGEWVESGAADDAELESRELAFTAGSVHELRAQHSNKCLDVAAAGTADGTNIQQWNCNGTNAQRFRVESRAGGYYRLVAQNSNKCVDIAGSGTGDGVNVQLW